MYKKARCTCNVVVKPIAFLRPQHGFPNMVLKEMIIERVLHVSTLYEVLDHVMFSSEFPLSLYKTFIQ